MEEARTFRIDTEVVPPEVDVQLAAERTRLIEAWRTGEAEAEETFEKLLNLYWSTRGMADDATRYYLIKPSWEFPVEAGIDHETASRLYRASQRKNR